MIQILFALAGLALVVWMLSPPSLRQHLRRLARRGGFWIGLILLVLLFASGRMHWLMGALGGAALLVMRLLPWLRLLPVVRRLLAGTPSAAAGGVKGDGPLRGHYVQLWINEADGTMDGHVLKGNWRGWRLSRLSLDELQALLVICDRDDPNSAALLKAYLDHHHGRRPGTSGSDVMSPAEARAILGVDETADETAITQAHRRLIQRLHPDRGGSDLLAARVNEAKRTLLRKR